MPCTICEGQKWLLFKFSLLLVIERIYVLSLLNTNPMRSGEERETHLSEIWRYLDINVRFAEQRGILRSHPEDSGGPEVLDPGPYDENIKVRKCDLIHSPLNPLYLKILRKIKIFFQICLYFLISNIVQC